jgi:Coenzyme F420-dependent N5,N10-methylene tetrahydromethanopterin reductase and related flavin-dependent oxidoreductases
VNRKNEKTRGWNRFHRYSLYYKRYRRVFYNGRKNDFECVWIAEDYYLRDAISIISCIALSTKEIAISSGVINPFTRHPVLIAQTIATLNDIALGRIRLALGTGVKPLIEGMGIQFKKPLKHIAEAVKIIRSLLEGKRVDFEGEAFKIKGVKLGENPYFVSESNFLKVYATPIYIAAIGPKMLRLAASISDGILLTAGLAPENVERMVKDIKNVVNESGRDFSKFLIGNYILTHLGEPSNMLKTFIAFHVAYSDLKNLFEVGITEEYSKTVRETLEKKGIKETIPLIKNNIVEFFAACGTIEEIQSRIEEYRKAGVSHPIILPVETDTARLINSLA